MMYLIHHLVPGVEARRDVGEGRETGPSDGARMEREREA